MRISADYELIAQPTECTREYVIKLTREEQQIDIYGVVIDTSTDVCQISIDLPITCVARDLSMPLIFSCIRDIINKKITTLSVHHDSEHTTSRNKKGSFIIGGCGYTTCATIVEKDSLIKIMVMKDAIGDIRILEMLETECSMCIHNRTSSENESLYKEALIEYLTEQCLDNGHAYYRPKSILLHGFSGLSKLSTSALEEDVKLWFGNGGMSDVRTRLAIKIKQCER